ncbi:hypothetical protein BCR41DRAFT_365251 [Lobosporangium transversale]|uniref:Uncharacterized protein n=1 Tax=Lobosporangium transversale TaxID=64571 RepID=A0A1Y2G5H3_9FUNG|nr:hypothetical protein BCR41DRAFT_365251 [Lobosporangium transversale]ORY95135.1 hypothetical protein BCR41DRAFT_365251 [Lobosporangium transversale]|eukprot:XP_021875342.1 hypothetical protein BCR41DRAFT_365251 [Lobosporangium transversale]
MSFLSCTIAPSLSNTVSLDIGNSAVPNVGEIVRAREPPSFWVSNGNIFEAVDVVEVGVIIDLTMLLLLEKRGFGANGIESFGFSLRLEDVKDASRFFSVVTLGALLSVSILGTFALISVLVLMLISVSLWTLVLVMVRGISCCVTRCSLCTSLFIICSGLGLSALAP